MHTDEFKQEAVWIALICGPSRRRITSDWDVPPTSKGQLSYINSAFGGITGDCGIRDCIPTGPE